LTEFLSFARPKPPVKELIDVASILQQLSDLLQADHRFESIEILVYDENRLELMLDCSQILQALWDLAINATEAMQGRGRLVFRTLPDGILVEDSGPGIPNEIRSRIFEPFFSTKEKGTGLGLASVYSILEAHGGSISVENNPQGGARFYLQFNVGDPV